MSSAWLFIQEHIVHTFVHCSVQNSDELHTVSVCESLRAEGVVWKLIKHLTKYSSMWKPNIIFRSAAGFLVWKLQYCCMHAPTEILLRETLRCLTAAVHTVFMYVYGYVGVFKWIEPVLNLLAYSLHESDCSLYITQHPQYSTTNCIFTVQCTVLLYIPFHAK